MWTCHIFCLGPFLKKLGLKSIEQKKVLNEGVMACSINMESIFLVALARRASTKISEDLAECVKVDNFFSLFFPSIPSLEKLVQVFDEHFPNNKSLWAEFLSSKFRCFFGDFASPQKTWEKSRGFTLSIRRDWFATAANFVVFTFVSRRFGSIGSLQFFLFSWRVWTAQCCTIHIGVDSTRSNIPMINSLEVERLSFEWSVRRDCCFGKGL